MVKSKIDLKIHTKPLDNDIEKYICNKLDLSPYKSYGKMSDDDINNLYLKIKKKFPNLIDEEPEYYFKIIMSIRANLMREHMILTHKNIIINKNKIIRDYKDGFDVLELSEKYDASPLNILRLVFLSKYKKKLTQLIKKKSILTQTDKRQLDKAIDNDLYALINQDEVLKKSTEFESKIQNILDLLGIKYKTQEQLAEKQVKELGKAINTPDFLILDNLVINGVKINWIDAKNFYGLNIKYLKKRIKHQTIKYLNEWGSGAIIFNLGFGSNLFIDDILFIDYNSFEKLNPNDN